MASRFVRFVHLAGVVLFLGNFVGAWLVYFQARRIADPAVVRRLFGVVNLGDRWVTPISVVILAVSGFYAAGRRGLSITETGWIIWSLVLLGFSGVVFVARLRGLQIKLELPEQSALDLPAYRGLLASWARWAVVGTVAVVAAFVLMALQPALPGW